MVIYRSTYTPFLFSSKSGGKKLREIQGLFSFDFVAGLDYVKLSSQHVLNNLISLRKSSIEMVKP